jgi:predicted RecB family endonuclease
MPEMTAEQAAEWGKSLSFEKVWAAMLKSEERLDRLFGEVAQKQAEAAQKQAEAAEQIKEVGRKQAKTDEQIAQLEKTVERVSNNGGGLNRSMGELIETLIAARLWEKFPQYGLNRAYQRIPVYGEKNEIKTDIDILLVNTTMCMAVEVKHELDRMDDVSRHLKRMQLIRQYPPEQVNGKELVGAMAGGVVDPEVKNYAYESGFFVLELSGESIQLITPPEGFTPKKWQGGAARPKPAGF